MALKIGKCRLCLKLGDFFSIFVVDDNMQLAEMVMECARVKIQEGDGLPDKICPECVQKLSGAYIFKQQCERSDQELRKNHVPPSGITSTTSPPINRQSSDSAFSTQTDTSKPSSQSIDTPANRIRKRCRDSAENLSSVSQEYLPLTTKRIDQLRTCQKRRKLVYTDSGTESDDSNFSCDICSKSFKSYISMVSHRKCHLRKDRQPYSHGTRQSDVGNSRQSDVDDSGQPHIGDTSAEQVDEDRSKCETCGRVFKLSVMLKRHQEVCGKMIDKELKISLVQVDTVKDEGKLDCSMCSAVLQSDDSLNEHMRTVHGVLKSEGLVVPCLYCRKPFDEYYALNAHFKACPSRDDTLAFMCTLCESVLSSRGNYNRHIKTHFYPNHRTDNLTAKANGFKKSLPSREESVKYGAVLKEEKSGGDEESWHTLDESASVHSEYQRWPEKSPLQCPMCDRSFKYKKSLETHQQMKHAVKEEHDDESDSDTDDNTCDICDKQFSYRRLLLNHKRTKHNASSGTKRAKITLKECLVKCLICEVEMKVGAVNEHNNVHMMANVKPRNLYTCVACTEQFKSCSALANHIKIVHRLRKSVPDMADFCEVVVTKAEPDTRGYNDGDEAAEHVCPTCGKVMPTPASLKRHVSWHTSVGNNVEKKLQCFVCLETFRFQCHYKMHMRQHYSDTSIDPKYLTCHICNRKSKHLRAAQAHMNFHKQTRFKTKDYGCSICKRVFQYRKVYLTHMAMHLKKGDSANNTVIGTDIPNSADKTAYDGTHTCTICQKVCDSETSLKCHLVWHKSKTMLYATRHECDICHLQFTNKVRLKVHRRSHFEDENGPFKCNTCGKGFTLEEYYRRHLKSHNFDNHSHKKRIERLRKGKVKCPICTRYYPDVVKLIRHLRRTHPQSKMIKEDPDAPAQVCYPCKLCAKVFLDERRLHHHEMAHLRKPEFFKCKFCAKKTISLKSHRVHIKGHLSQKYVDVPLECAHCSETFSRGYDLHYHLRDVHNIEETWIDNKHKDLNGPLKELQCSICLKVLASKGNYERHIDYHNSLRCNYCFDYFSNLRFLEGHLMFSCEKKMLIGDTEEYPRKVKCDICYKAFHLQVKLDCHLRTQHGIKSFKEAMESKKDLVCDFCFRVFENEYALSSHKLYHRGVGYFGCIYCSRKFNTTTMYRKHKNHHLSQLNVDNPTKCEHCDETFVSFREFIYHMRDAHGDNKEWITYPKKAIEETCTICDKTFFNLHRHLAYHEMNKCKKCDEYFFSVTDFDNHICHIDSDDAHDGAASDVRPQFEECAFCFKPITEKTKRKHDVLHKGSGSISCRFCPLKFKTIDAFNIHAFSHRNRKYQKRPICCRICGERFVRYGPFVRHMRAAHRCTKKMHYRTTIKPERCVVCGGHFPNLHNHYRAHLLNRCLQCSKYFTSSKLFSQHECGVDEDPSKVFTSDANLPLLINTYVPLDEKDDEKFYGYEEVDDSQNSVDAAESTLHEMAYAPIISDVLSLYEKEEETEEVHVDAEEDAILVVSDESVDGQDNPPPIITIDD